MKTQPILVGLVPEDEKTSFAHIVVVLMQFIF